MIGGRPTINVESERNIARYLKENSKPASNRSVKLDNDFLPVRYMNDVTNEIWEKFEQVDGFFINDRMYNEAIRRSKFTESRRNNAKSVKTDSISEAYEKHMPKHMETETEIINKKDIFINSIQPFVNLLGVSYQEFVDYWTEPSKSGKLRYEAQKFFDIKRRVNTWLQNKNKYGNSKNTDATATSRKRMEDLTKWVNQ